MKFILYTFVLLLLSNQFGIYFLALIVLAWIYKRIIWIPIPVIITAYIWYHIEPLYWYLRLSLGRNYFLKRIDSRRQITFR